jgi:hypothetical protein
MADDAMLGTKEELKKAANLLREAADKMATRRTEEFDKGAMSFEEFRFNVSRENLLRNDVAEMIVKAINAGIEGVKGEQADLEAAIVKADGIIEQIANLKKALSAFAALIGLAEAIVVGQPAAILVAFKDVQKATA